jgi:predicted AAA+ superfamily ATPase
MPEAVKYYVENRELSGIEQIHSDLISSIQYDFAKYGTRKQQESLIDVLNYAARNIGRKVVYAHVNKNATSQSIKDAFLKLEMSRIIHLVRQTKSTEVPLTHYQRNDVFKPVFYDIGLVNHLAGIRLVDIQNLITAHEGALAEQFVFQELISNNMIWKEFTPYYWFREAKNSNAEIDCIIQLQNKVFPVEIKAGKRGTLKSLHVYLAEKGKKSGIRFNADVPSIGLNLTAQVNLPDKDGISYNLISLPLYLSGVLRSLQVDEMED